MRKRLQNNWERDLYRTEPEIWIWIGTLLSCYKASDPATKQKLWDMALGTLFRWLVDMGRHTARGIEILNLKGLEVWGFDLYNLDSQYFHDCVPLISEAGVRLKEQWIDTQGTLRKRVDQPEIHAAERMRLKAGVMLTLYAVSGVMREKLQREDFDGRTVSFEAATYSKRAISKSSPGITNLLDSYADYFVEISIGEFDEHTLADFIFDFMNEVCKEYKFVKMQQSLMKSRKISTHS